MIYIYECLCMVGRRLIKFPKILHNHHIHPHALYLGMFMFGWPQGYQISPKFYITTSMIYTYECLCIVWPKVD